ncbi:MAG: hypothetical protein R3B89_28380, partial [Polyangiaceae bacterium]
LAPCLLAGRLGAPILAVFASREADGRQRLRLAGCVSPPEAGEPLKDWAAATAQLLNDWLGERVRAEPADWLWMHRRWKGAPGVQPSEVRSLLGDGNAEGSSA